MHPISLEPRGSLTPIGTQYDQVGQNRLKGWLVASFEININTAFDTLNSEITSLVVVVDLWQDVAG